MLTDLKIEKNKFEVDSDSEVESFYGSMESKFFS